MAISYREFVNTDPPFIVEIWRRQKRFRGIADRISHQMFDDLVQNKLYFDRHGLILAFQDGHPVGFVQTGFCPVPDLTDLDRTQGVLSQLRVVDGDFSKAVSRELIERAEAYLVGQGSRTIHVGGRFPYSPFYHGMYGGSRIPGVLAEDQLMHTALRESGYDNVGEVIIYQRRLAGFRGTVDRQQMTVRRQFQVNADTDPPFQSWWEACTLGSANRTRFDVTDRRSTLLAGSVTFWDIQPLASCWGVHAMGMYDLKINEDQRRCGIATFLVGEALRHLAQEGVGLVEAQSRTDDVAACGVFAKHGFESIGKGILMAKSFGST